jgi:hypothetical protein
MKHGVEEKDLSTIGDVLETDLLLELGYCFRRRYGLTANDLDCEMVLARGLVV